MLLLVHQSSPAQIQPSVDRTQRVVDIVNHNFQDDGSVLGYFMVVETKTRRNDDFIVIMKVGDTHRGPAHFNVLD